MSTAAVIVAAGRSERFAGDVPKPFREVAGRPLLSWTISRFESAQRIDNIVVVAPEQYLVHSSEHAVDPFGFSKVTKIVAGGALRHESVLRGLKALPGSTEMVAIHDGARPLVRPRDIDCVVDRALQDGAAILAVPVTETVKRARDGIVQATLDRRLLYLAQTPQVFKYRDVLDAHREVAAADPGLTITDDASLMEACGVMVSLVEPTGPNPKVTVPDDLRVVAMYLKEESGG